MGLEWFQIGRYFGSTLGRSSYREGHRCGMVDGCQYASVWVGRKNGSDCEIPRVAQRIVIDVCSSDNDLEIILGARMTV
jgi:hypothetical protein